MLGGAGMDNSVVTADTGAVKKKKEKRECANNNNNNNNKKKKSPSNDAVLQALQYGTQRELQLAGLQY
jgi:hypothetical protein